jgi:mRNA-degrading endonuclease YafQ of YafQ-DinJ toxin-antitoxin module
MPDTDNKKILCIDDVKTVLSATHTARTYNEAIIALTNDGPWDIVYLDHDLGGKKTGYDILCYLENNKDLLPKEIRLITLNPVGRANMLMKLKKLYPRG